MKTEWLNNRQPLPAGHPKAGQIGAVIDFEDGRPDTQKVYAASEADMSDKLLAMYGNTNVRLAQVKNAPRTVTPPATPAPATPATPTGPQRMTADERMQTVADMNDPSKAGKAIKKLLKEDTGVDLDQINAQNESQTEVNRLQNETNLFIQANPEWMQYASKSNAKLLRDRTWARLGGRKATAADFEQSFRDLESDGVLQSVTSQVEEPARTTEEPLAPPPESPRGSTSYRPSTLQGNRQPARNGSRLTRAEALAMAGTDEYERRVKSEPGFLAEVDRVLASR